MGIKQGDDMQQRSMSQLHQLNNYFFSFHALKHVIRLQNSNYPIK